MSSSSSGDNRPNPATIPAAVVQRLSMYLRELRQMVDKGKKTTSSRELGRQLGLSDAQVRKDLANFGQFGHPGIGYRSDELVEVIRTILGTNRQWRVALVGAGNLGRALLGYRGFTDQGFRIVAAFDTDAEKIGKQIGGVSIASMARMDELVVQMGIELGLVAVQASQAQAVADRLIAAGISGILNFAPVTLKTPPHITKVGVDLAQELEQVTFRVVNQKS
jgi:redox-sensing transcriptional repressor